MFAGFILACGTTHLMEIWNIWHGDYVLAGVIKAITAVLSVLTAAMLIPLTPKAIALPALQTLNRELEAALKDLLEQKFALDQHAIVATTARPPSPVTGLQPEMEVPDRNRKHGTRCRRGDSINRIILADRRNR
jgi:ribosomal protein L34